MRRTLALLLALLLSMTAVGCGADTAVETTTQANNITAPTEETTSAANMTVGICLPEDSSDWQTDAQGLSSGLESMGYLVELQYAQNDALQQMQQIERMITGQVNCLVVAAVDAFMLTDVLQKAKDAGIPVIAYDRLLMNTDAVVCYVGFDHTTAGVEIGNYIVAEKNLDTAAEEKRKYTIELFMGAPEDQNALMLYQGIMGVLQPYFDSKVLLCKSGRTAFEDVCTPGWSTEEAKTDCSQYIAEHYADTLPDILCAASDSIAQGCVEALEALEAVPGENWPLITGQGADAAAVERILSGQQTMSAYKDRQALVRNCVEVTESTLTLSPEKIGNASFYNGVKAFPGCLVWPIMVDAENCREVLADSGIFTAEE